MKQGMKSATGALAILLILGVIYVMNFGLYPRYFDIAWDEEVQLHDGRVIVVHVKYKYQRKGLRLERLPESPYQMGMEFSFDRGTPFGRFTHTFQRGDLVFLDNKDGKWYIGYYGDPGTPSVEIGSQELYPHVAIVNSDGSISKPKTWDEIPVEITRMNIMPPTPNAQVISKFSNKSLTIEEKMKHWAAYPTGSGEHEIHRRTPQKPNFGEKK